MTDNERGGDITRLAWFNAVVADANVPFFVLHRQA